MSTITLQEAQSHLPDLIHQLTAGEELIITQDEKPVARLTGIQRANRTPRPRPPVTGIPKAGLYAGRLVVTDAFDEPLDELTEYMS